MRLLYLAHRVPYPPTKGDKIRAFHEIRALAARGHAVHLYAFADDPADLSWAPALEAFCASVTILPLSVRAARARALAAIPSRDSLSVRYFGSAWMRAAVREGVRVARPDAAVVYSSTMAQYVPAGLRARTVVDLVDVDSAKWDDYSHRSAFPANAVYRLEARRLRAYETAIVRDFPAVVLTTAREASLLAAPGLPDRVHALVNGVDTDHFHPAPALPEPGPPHVVFTGALDYRPNVDAVQFFADAVWPHLIATRDLRFSIVGSRPVRQVSSLAARPGIEVHADVPDIRPHLQRAAVVVAPLRIARGVQNKVLEAMACGRAVVATPLAVAALDVRDGVHVRVGATPRAMAEAVLDLLNDAGRRAALGAAARAYVEAHHRWDAMLDRFCELVEARAASDALVPQAG